VRQPAHNKCGPKDAKDCTRAVSSLPRSRARPLERQRVPCACAVCVCALDRSAPVCGALVRSTQRRAHARATARHKYKCKKTCNSLKTASTRDTVRVAARSNLSSSPSRSSLDRPDVDRGRRSSGASSMTPRCARTPHHTARACHGRVWPWERYASSSSSGPCLRCVVLACRRPVRVAMASSGSACVPQPHHRSVLRWCTSC
jgi:hypothetical protein